MKADLLLENLIGAVKEKLPPGTNLAKTLSETLFMGKEAVYRRLRGEVPFTFTEIATISEKLNISLDNTVGLSAPQSAMFHLKYTRFYNPGEKDYAQFDECNGLLRDVADRPYSEMGSSSNTLPMQLVFKYPSLARLRNYKWLYHHERNGGVKPFHETETPPRLLQCQRDFAKYSMNIKNNFFIWDSMVFQYMINDIRYFQSIHMLNNDDINQLKEEIFELIDDAEKVAGQGHFDNGNKIDIYISNTNFETTYTYVETDISKLSLIRVFTLNNIASTDEKIFQCLKDWIQSLKRLSILISESGEMQRVHFFNEQRRLAGEL